MSEKPRKSSVEDEYSIKNILTWLKKKEGETYEDRLRRAQMIREAHLKKK